METTKIRVPLASVLPDELNPREDFGDIAALAGTIAATGGDPVNPIVCVRDGSAYRIVDGERRYRAIRELRGGDPAATCEVLACDSLDDARALTAMLATDDKRPLTEAERAKGLQDMLILGVDDLRVSQAARVDVETVKRVRRVAKAAPQARQATIEQMAAAAEFEDEGERERVLSAGGRWAYEVDEIKREHKLAEAQGKVERAADALGVEVLPECALEAAGLAESDLGLNGPGPLKALAEAGASIAPNPKAAWPLGPDYSGNCLYSVWLPEGVADPRDGGKDDGQRELERLAAESTAAVASAKRSMAAAFAAVIADPDPRRRRTLERKALELRPEIDEDDPARLLLCGHRAEEFPVGAWELVMAAWNQLNACVALRSQWGYGSSGVWKEFACTALLRAAKLAGACGWKPNEAEAALLEEAREHAGRE